MMNKRLATTWARAVSLRVLVAAVLPVVGVGLGVEGQTTKAGVGTGGAVKETAGAFDGYLAERMIDFAQRSFEMGGNNLDLMRVGQLLHEAATRLSPGDARLAQLAVDAAVATGDTTAALEATLRLARLDPSDRLVQQRLVGLYAAKAETTTARLAYLTDMIGKSPVPEEVRSHAAFLAAQTYLERGQTAQAIAAVGQSLRLNAMNVEALKLNFDLVSQDGTPFEQVRGLLAILRAVPTDAVAASEMAELLARAGLRQQSLYWYDVALALKQRSGAAPSADFVLDYAVQLYISGDGQSAETLAGALLKFDPEMLEAALLRAVMTRGTDAGAAHVASARQAITAALADVATAAEAAAKGVEATNRAPGAAAAMPDLKALVASVKGTGWEGRVVSLLSDLAFMDLYSVTAAAGAAEVQPLIDAVRELRGPADPAVVRLEGWQLVSVGKNAEARVKLAAVAESDPLSELGLIQIAETDEASQTLANTKARGLLTRHQAALLGAVVHQALRDRGQQVPTSDVAEAIKAELNGFPEKLLGVIDRPQDFYAVRVDPLSVVVKFGQPMLARVTIANTSPFDLTVSPGGVIRPDLWMDANIRGANARLFSATSLERLSSTTLLKSRQSISQIVRLDRGALGSSLAASPDGTFAVYGTLIMNPVAVGFTTAEGKPGQAIQPGPAGYAVQFARLFERSGMRASSDADRERLVTMLKNGPAAGQADLRASAVEVLGVYLRAMAASPQAAEMKPAVDQLRQALEETARSQDGALRGLALYQLLSTASGAEAERLAARMAGDADWRVRVLGIIGLPSGTKSAALDGLGQDGDALVAALARTLTGLRARSGDAATTRP